MKRRPEWIRVDGAFYDALTQNCHIRSIHGDPKEKNKLYFRSFRDLTKNLIGHRPDKLHNLLKENAKYKKK